MTIDRTGSRGAPAHRRRAAHDGRRRRAPSTCSRPPARCRDPCRWPGRATSTTRSAPRTTRSRRGGPGRRGSAATRSSGSADLLERRARRAGPPVGARQRHDLRHRPLHRHLGVRLHPLLRRLGRQDRRPGHVVARPRPRAGLHGRPSRTASIGIIITWNGPLVSIGMKVIPALAAGNTVVVKPSELTPVRDRALHGPGPRGRHPRRCRQHAARNGRGRRGARPPPARAEDQLHRRADGGPGASSPTAPRA